MSTSTSSPTAASPSPAPSAASAASASASSQLLISSALSASAFTAAVAALHPDQRAQARYNTSSKGKKYHHPDLLPGPELFAYALKEIEKATKVQAPKLAALKKAEEDAVAAARKEAVKLHDLRFLEMVRGIEKKRAEDVKILRRYDPPGTINSKIDATNIQAAAEIEAVYEEWEYGVFVFTCVKDQGRLERMRKLKVTISEKTESTLKDKFGVNKLKLLQAEADWAEEDEDDEDDEESEAGGKGGSDEAGSEGAGSDAESEGVDGDEEDLDGGKEKEKSGEEAVVVAAEW